MLVILLFLHIPLQAFDPTSAFFTKVVSKKKKNTLNIDVNPSGKKEKSHDKRSDEEVSLIKVLT